MSLKLMRPIHVSWHIAWCSIGILVGTSLASLLTNDAFINPQWLVVGAALFLIAIIKRARVLIVVAVLSGLLLGIWRGSQVQVQLKSYLAYYDHRVTLAGQVSEDTSVSPDGDQQLHLTRVEIEGRTMAGEVWTSTLTDEDIKRGDIVTLKGRLAEGFGNLPAAMYRAELVKVTRPQPGDIARRLRDWFAAGVRRGMPEPEASLGIGYLVGQRSTLPQKLDEQLRILGLTHIVVASGYNLTILVRLTRRRLAGTSKYLATLAASLMIVGFMMVTGFSPSMSRAALVTGLSLAAWYYGRAIHPLVLLPFAASLTVLINPSYIWGDVGWYLSFAAFGGVIILAPILQRFFWGNQQSGTLRQILVETTAAQIMTIPLIAFTFGQYAPLALPANLLILPLIPLAMVLTFLAGLAGINLPAIAGWLSWPATAVLRYMTTIVDRLASLPLAYGEISFELRYLVISYVLITAIMWWLWRKTGHSLISNIVT